MSNQQTVKKSIKEAVTSPATMEVMKGNRDQLKEAAAYFIEKVNQNYEMAIQHEGLLEDSSSFTNGRQILYDYMRQSTNFTREITELQHYFEAQLDNFLGRVIYFTWVDQNSGNILYLDQVETKEVYKKATKDVGSGALTGGNVRSTIRSHTVNGNNIDITTINTSTQSKMEAELKRKLRQSQIKRQYVYLTAISRFKDPRNGDRFWWKPSGQRHRGWSRKFNGTGRIAEGYVNAVVNEDPNVQASSEGNALEVSLKFLHDLIEIESIPGIVKGDIVMDSNGNIQFAVKTGQGFNAAKFGPAYILATEILYNNALDDANFQTEIQNVINQQATALAILQNIYNQVESRTLAEIKP